MYVDLLDRLRCPNPHEDSWLVATALRTEDGRILDGTVGCPVCGAEFVIRDGEVWFGADDLPAPDEGEGDPGEVLRLGALLALDARGGLYVLDGPWGRLAGDLSAVSPASRLLLLSPPPDAPPWPALRGAGEALPLATGCARGVALGRPSAALAGAASRVLAANGRLVAPIGTPVPDEITILARDARQWVGERVATGTTSALVTPRRAAPRTERQ